MPLYLIQFEKQVISVMQQRKLTESDKYLRRLVCDLLYQCFVELDENVKVLPFGSAINGFGQSGSDLDITLLIDENAVKSKGFCKTTTENNNEEAATNHRSWNMFSVISKFIKDCIPGCTSVIALPNARQPVIKFKYNECNLSCDLTVNNRY